MNPIHKFSFTGNLNEIKKILRKFPYKLNEYDDIYERTPLQHATIKGQIEVIKFFLEEKNLKTLNHTDKSGFSALHYATFSGQFEVVELFFELKSKDLEIDGADNPKKFTPLHVATKYCRKNGGNVVSLLLKNNANYFLLSKDGLTAEQYSNDEVKLVFEKFKNGIYTIFEDEKDISKIVSKYNDFKRKAYPHLISKYLDCLTFNNIINYSKDDDRFVKLLCSYLKGVKRIEWKPTLDRIASIKLLESRFFFVLQKLLNVISYSDQIYLFNHKKYYSFFTYFDSSNLIMIPFIFLKKMWNLSTNNQLFSIIRFLKSYELLNEINWDEHWITLHYYHPKFLQSAFTSKEKDLIKQKILKSPLFDNSKFKDFDDEKRFQSFQSIVGNQEEMYEFSKSIEDDEKELILIKTKKEIPELNEKEKENQEEPKKEEEKQEENETKEENQEEKENSEEEKVDSEVKEKEKTEELKIEIKVKYSTTTSNFVFRNAVILGTSKTDQLEKLPNTKLDIKGITKMIEKHNFETIKTQKNGKITDICKKISEVLQKRKSRKLNDFENDLFLFYYTGYIIDNKLCSSDHSKETETSGIEINELISRIDESSSENSINFVVFHTYFIGGTPKSMCNFVPKHQFIILFSEIDKETVVGRYNISDFASDFLNLLFNSNLDFEEICKLLKKRFKNTWFISSIMIEKVILNKISPKKNNKDEIEQKNKENPVNN